MKAIDDITSEVIDASIRIHRELGPGLLESVYEIVLAGALARCGLRVDRQKPIDIRFEGLHFPAAFRIDLLIEECPILEIKSVEELSNAHGKQLLTYLRLTNQPVGLLLNFSRATMKEGIRRVVNDYHQPHDSSAPPRLRVNQKRRELT
ncbi:MAG: GxxExxY protein [Novosphingobium sp.]|nr:GxxExxY protein [Novosphingobium sp.]